MLYQVTDLFDVWGNPVSDYEVNDQRPAGTVIARSDRDIRELVEALVEAGKLNERAVEFFDSGLLYVEDAGDSLEVTETEEAWSNLEEGGTYVDQPITMTAEQVAEAEDDGYTAANYERVAGQRPLLNLDPVDADPDAKPFWRDLVETYGEHEVGKQKHKATLELRANPERLEGQKLRKGKGVLRIESHVDGEYFGTYDFPVDFENDTPLGIAVDGGVVALEEGGDVDVSELQVALDEFLERGGVAAKPFLKAPVYGEKGGARPKTKYLLGVPEEVEEELEKYGFAVVPCGLNADWSSQAWYLSRGHANRTDGGYYLLDTEDHRSVPGARIGPSIPDGEFTDELEMFTLVRQYNNVPGENTYVEEVLGDMDLVSIMKRISNMQEAQPYGQIIDGNMTPQGITLVNDYEPPPWELMNGEWPSAAELEGMPTISQAHTADLKFDNGLIRVWLERVGVADGMPYDNGVLIEQLVDGRWRTAREYGG